MIFIRSLLFNILFLGIWTPAVCTLCAPALFISTELSLKVGQLWARGSILLARICCGIRHQIIGKENIPEGACIFASKHQSAWDTIIFFLVVPNPAYVLKHELCKIPLFGHYLRAMKMISVKRSEGSKALKSMTEQAAERLKEGRRIVIFPEGTRTRVNERQPLHPGIAAIYNHPEINVPVVPVALNSGKLWGRDSFLKKPGLITLKLLSPIPHDLPRKQFMKQLEATIHSESEKLL